MKLIGITTTVPIEVLIAAGYKVIDLNNIFVSSQDYIKYIEIAEKDGFPKSSCAWIKGIYGVCVQNNIKEVIGVIQGDCSNTKALLEVYKKKGISVHPFSYPSSHKLADITASIDKFMETFLLTANKVENTRKKLNKIRNLAKRIDELTYIHNKATGLENHLYQVMLSDFNRDPQEFKRLLEQKIIEIEQRPPLKHKLRLGYIGVPPMTCDLYDYVEKLDARFVYNEVQREFAFPRGATAKNIYEQYHDYTYPYDLSFRLDEIKKQINERQLDALVHYTQTFCHRGIEDIVIKQTLDLPILTIEGDTHNRLDARTKLRLEAFLDMLLDLKEVDK
ncbi:2-hydroxyacyl-CoA dehydratase [Bacillota bacterium LX-D]|nr:2-hydroxyacyl-CoA dehydratase [Bacillota bacterium LX-D]